MKLDNRTIELIAVGASLAAHCQPCLQYHVRKAAENGADEQEIAEAIEVGKLVRKGAATNMDKFVASLNAPAQPRKAQQTAAVAAADRIVLDSVNGARNGQHENAKP
jgi:AhpD family alkylhydroperoxidase